MTNRGGARTTADGSTNEPVSANHDPDHLANEPTGDVSFEATTRRLAKIVELLEGGDLPLERSLKLFEEGMALARSAEDTLNHAERRVEELLGMDAQGKPILKSFET